MSMDNIPPYFVKAYAQEFQWTIDENNAICTYGRRPNSTRDKFVVPEEELSAKHPHLPLAIRALVAKYVELGRSAYVEALAVFATLEILRHGPIELTDKNGVKLTFSEVHDLALLKGGGVDITATSVSLDTVSVNNIELTIAHSPMYWCFAVSESELEEHYPGWHGKWAIGDELELPYPDLMRMVFTKGPAINTPTPLPDFTL